MLFAEIEAANAGWVVAAVSALGTLGLFIRNYITDKSKVKRDEFEQLFDQQGQTIHALEASLERVRTQCEQEIAKQIADKTQAVIRAERAETWILVLKDALERHGIQVGGVTGPGSGLHTPLVPPPGGGL